MHVGLFEAEEESGLPLRLAFAGLWCAADREGRFKWEPRRLGVQILPYDGLDFSRVLDALVTRGFVEKYASESAEFGWIPSFLTHQVINNRESASTLPNPSNTKGSDACRTRAGRVPDAGKAEGKGKEGKGKDAPPLPPDGGSAGAASPENPKDASGESVPEEPGEPVPPDLGEVCGKIAGLRAEWLRPVTWGSSELRAVRANLGQFTELSADDWEILRAFLRAKLPDSAAYWQPLSRGQFAKTFSDVWASATRWDRKSPAARTAVPPVPKTAPPPDAPPAEGDIVSPEGIRDFFRNLAGPSPVDDGPC